MAGGQRRREDDDAPETGCRPVDSQKGSIMTREEMSAARAAAEAESRRVVDAHCERLIKSGLATRAAATTTSPPPAARLVAAQEPQGAPVSVSRTAPDGKSGGKTVDSTRERPHGFLTQARLGFWFVFALFAIKTCTSLFGHPMGGGFAGVIIYGAPMLALLLLGTCFRDLVRPGLITALVLGIVEFSDFTVGTTVRFVRDESTGTTFLGLFLLFRLWALGDIIKGLRGTRHKNPIPSRCVESVGALREVLPPPVPADFHPTGETRNPESAPVGLDGGVTNDNNGGKTDMGKLNTAQRAVVAVVAPAVIFLIGYGIMEWLGNKHVFSGPHTEGGENYGGSHYSPSNWGHTWWMWALVMLAAGGVEFWWLKTPARREDADEKA